MAADEAAPDNPPLWQMTPLQAYDVPAAPAGEAAAKGLAALWRLIRKRKQPQQPPEKTDEQLQALSDEALARLAPAIDWAPGVAAIEELFSNWPESVRHRPSIVFVIGPPHCGQATMLEAWAKMRQSTMIAPPTSEQILNKDQRWLSNWQVNDRPWILPCLEECFLRHADGLGLVRSFFEHAFTAHLGFGVVGCDSWAWSYLQKIWAMPQCNAYTLQAFDSERLACYFGGSSTLPGNKSPCFRDVNNGRDVLQVHTPNSTDDTPTSSFLKYLAAQSRGNLGVAVAYWRAGLRAGADEPSESKTEEKSSEDLDPCKTVWLKTGLWDSDLPSRPSPEIAFVLHALLIHNGLPSDLLATVLPLPRDEVLAILLQLESAGVVQVDDSTWRVSALGYPMVRRFLKNNGYLVDSL